MTAPTRRGSGIIPVIVVLILILASALIVRQKLTQNKNEERVVVAVVTWTGEKPDYVLIQINDRITRLDGNRFRFDSPYLVGRYPDTPGTFYHLEAAQKTKGIPENITLQVSLTAHDAGNTGLRGTNGVATAELQR